MNLRPAELGYHKQAVARIAQAENETPRKFGIMRIWGEPSDSEREHLLATQFFGCVSRF